MSQALEELFEAVRRACDRGVWSRGVELARAEAVVGEEAADDEIVVRVRTRGGMVSPRVLLWPADAEWDCECPASDVCEHVAAAVIALRRAREEGDELPVPQGGAGRVGYRLTRDRGKLALERVIVAADGTERALETTLAGVASGRVAGPAFAAAPADLAVELALETHRRGVVPPPIVSRLLRRLAACDDVTLDGRPVRASSDAARPRAVVADRGEGFFVSVEPDPTIDETFANGIALCGDVLRPLSAAPLTAREREDLVPGRYVPADGAASLVTEILPALRKRMPVHIATERLPRTADEPPRVDLAVERRGDTLEVLATIVYGDPPRGRLDGDRLVHLGGPVPVRDPRAEKRLLRRLGTELGLAPGIREAYEGEAAVAMAERLSAWEGVRGRRALERFHRAPPLVPRVRIEGERLEIAFVADPGSGSGHRGSADARTVLAAWRDGEPLVPLLEGGFSPPPAAWLERHGRLLADLLAARDAAGRVARGALPDLARLAEELGEPVPPDLDRLRRALEASGDAPHTRLPGDLATPLRDYQRRGVDWLVLLRDAGLGALLADDMGLGKTLQALCAIQGRTLVVCPTSVLHNWLAEAARHRPALRATRYHGPGRALDPGADLTVTSYALLRLDADALAAERWDTVILDESQMIKNPDSQVAAAAFRLDAGFRIALTGTPVENRLVELWSQLRFVSPGLLGSREDFGERYADPIARGDAEAAARLRERIRPFLLRRIKQDVARELPPRTDMVLRSELTADERAVYDAVRAATVPGVVERLEAGGGVMEALEALLRLRQACCHPALLPGGTARGSSKVEVLLEALDNVVAEGHKALVFSQWTSLLDLVEPHLEAAGIERARLDGATRDRAAVVEGFQREDGPPVLLVSLKAGGTGLNLTAADHVFLLDPWWNPAVEDQAADRAHRIGQTRPVLVYRLIAADTVEERILELQERKRDLARAAVQDADPAARLGRDDLLDLLR